MPKIALPSQIRLEDFNDEERELAEKIAAPYNSFSDDVYRQINGNLTFDNLDRQLVTLDVGIDGSGLVQNRPQIKLSIRTKISGIKVINARNLNDSSIYPTSCPFVSYDPGDGIITIKNITGLQPNSRYNLTLEIIGS